MKRIAVIGSGIAGLAAARGLAPLAQVTLFEGRQTGSAATRTRSMSRSTAGCMASTSASPSSTNAPRRSLPPCSPSSASPRRRPRCRSRPRFPPPASSGAAPARAACSRSPATCCGWRSGTCSARCRASTATPPPLARSAHDIAHDDSVGDFLGRASLLEGLSRLVPAAAARLHLVVPGRADAAHAGRRHGALLPRPRPAAMRCAGRAGARFAAAPTSTSDACWPRSPTPAWRRRCGASGGCRSAAPTSRPTAAPSASTPSSSPATASTRSPSSPTRATTSARCWAPSTTSATGRSCTPTFGVLPLREAAWAAWNYEAGRDAGGESTARLRPRPRQSPAAPAVRGAGDRLAQSDPGAGSGVGAGRVPLRPPDLRPARARRPGAPARACRAAPTRWFCGAWTGLGSHEDGLASALAVCAGLAPRL